MGFVISKNLLGSEPESVAVDRECAASRVCSPAEQPIVVAYGGGTNSTAMLCGFRERGITPSLLLFADTGGELPHTYQHIDLMNKKCQEWWGLEIHIVYAKYQGKKESLEEMCIRKKQLPSLVYGRKACSIRYKQEPQKRAIKQWMKERGISEIIQTIGYDAGEGHRATYIGGGVLGKGYTSINWYPLIEWNWKRQECVEAIARHGIPQPAKSSCFFCPAMKNAEILKLREQYPEYFERAIAMEKNMEVKGRVKGLAFGVPWSEIVQADDDQLKLFEWLDQHDAPHVPCGCYDG